MDPDDATLIITARTDAGTTVVAVVGELDLLSADQLRAAVADALAGRPTPTSVVLDMTEVGFCDSTGISVLVAARNQAAELGATFHVNASDPVARILDIVGLTSLFQTPDGDEPHQAG
ncbi:STAS domain-containing protein [Streptodolium elevatio]|uniref:Anti-sigma factor antagonist n=1 Tax=Streptodolium elevatio TaxID=3157996 RepID=A0ABV3DWY0_9ACTN